MIEHTGFSPYRQRGNPKEKVFAEAWSEKAPSTLGWLMSGSRNQKDEYSERDAQVAATMIQWLGSPVGFAFLSECLEKIDNLELPGGIK